MAIIIKKATCNHSMTVLRPAVTDRILVIEHDGPLQRILRRLFSSEGYEVDVVPNGYGALNALCQKTPSAVVLDLPHSEALDCELCRKIVNLVPGLPFVILAANSEEGDKARFLEMGASEYLTIPFSPKELARCVRRLIRRRSRIDVRNLYPFESGCLRGARCGS